MKTIIQFDNQEHAAKQFIDNLLEPKLKVLGQNVRILFQDYRDRLKVGVPVLLPREAASRGIKQWESATSSPEKTVWILDLDATDQSTPNSSYGLCVLLKLAEEMGMSINAFLGSNSMLTVIRTFYPEELRSSEGVSRLFRPTCDLSALDKLWHHLDRISNNALNRVTDQEIERAVSLCKSNRPRIVLSNSSNDDVWVSRVISGWIAV